MTHSSRGKVGVLEKNGKVEMEVYANETSMQNGGPKIVKRGTVPQSFRFLVGLLDGGIDAAQAILDDMKADRDALKRKHGV